MSTTANSNIFKTQVLGHPAGLFVLFFTEMWERFSFYGMRVLLINFLTMSFIGSNPGWGWSQEEAFALYGTYAGLLYVTPIVGGMIADKYTGARIAVVIGAIIMTLGHASMAFETQWGMFLGLGLLVLGTGFFKPNMPSMISQIYKQFPEKKDSAFTIFYMGVNAGAFFGMMMCGYLAERVGWRWGFGLAGIFMLLGCLQFWLARPLFGSVGDRPKGQKNLSAEDSAKKYEETKRNPFTLVDILIIAATAIIGLLFLFNDPLSKIQGVHILPEEFLFSKDTIQGQYVIILIAVVLFLGLLVSRVLRYEKVVRNRMFAVMIFAFFVIFFWTSFEQGASTLIIFARDYTQRTLVGGAALAFNIVNALLIFVPLTIISYVLIRLFKSTRHKILSSNIILGASFLIIWVLAIGIVFNDVSKNAYNVEYEIVKVATLDDNGVHAKSKNGELLYDYLPAIESNIQLANAELIKRTGDVSVDHQFTEGQKIDVHLEAGKLIYLDSEMRDKVVSDYKKNNLEVAVTTGTVIKENTNQAEITTSWFSILNSFFIIALASLFSKIWDSRFNPPAAVKYGMGLIIMSIGFGILAFGASAIPAGAEAGVVRVSMMWLVFAYLFHTMGELCLSPVGLSYVSKLVPGRMIAFMFGVWYLALAVGQKLAASVGGMAQQISEDHSMSTFFLIFTIVPMLAGVAIIALTPVIKRLMGGIR